jgi:hypothetical protein
VFAVVLTAATAAFGQTTQPGAAIDIEILNPADGSNAFCVSPGETLNARVFVRPGSESSSCDLSCSPPAAPGGSANIATAVIDIEFDGEVLSYLPSSIQSNTSTAAVQGLAQEQNIADDRIGWALAGAWSTPGDPGSTLLSPCTMAMVTTADWLFSVDFQVTGTGMSALHLRRESDSQPFALSFADICGTEAFKASNGGIDEIKDAVVMVGTECADILFFDGFDGGDAARWSAAAGS